MRKLTSEIMKIRIDTTNKKSTLDLIKVLFENNIGFVFDEMYNYPFKHNKTFIIEERDFVDHKDRLLSVTGISVNYL